MRKRFLMVLVSLLVVSLLGATVAWASPGGKTFLPPGLQKKVEQNKPLPPPFQNMEQREVSGEIEGEVVLVRKVADSQWMVIDDGKVLKSIKLKTNENFTVGDVVNIKFTGNNATSITLITKAEEQKEFKLSIDPAEAKLGEEVSFNFKVYNHRDEKVTYEFNSSQRYDFIVKSEDGKKIWQWSDTEAFLTVMQNVTIESKQSITYKENWKPETTGKFKVKAYFLGADTNQPVAVADFVVK